MDVVFTCEETPSKPEEGAVNYNAFCILTDIPGEGVVLDYWFVFSYEQTWYATTGSKMLDYYVLNDSISDNKSHEHTVYQESTPPQSIQSREEEGPEVSEASGGRLVLQLRSQLTAPF